MHKTIYISVRKVKSAFSWSVFNYVSIKKNSYCSNSKNVQQGRRNVTRNEESCKLEVHMYQLFQKGPDFVYLSAHTLRELLFKSCCFCTTGFFPHVSVTVRYFSLFSQFWCWSALGLD